VTIQEGKETEETFHLVGSQEADPRNGNISFNSPIGQALMGHGVGDTITVITPGGEIRLKILRIK
jgi:transcription elongation factor GreA